MMPNDFLEDFELDDANTKRREEIKNLLYKKLSRKAHFYHIIVSFPYCFKTRDIVTFTNRAKSLLVLLQKRLLHYKNRFHKDFYDTDIFFENKHEKEPFHLHILSAFIGQSGKQLSRTFVEDCVKKACVGFEIKHDLSGKMDVVVKFIPRKDALYLADYCTKELIKYHKSTNTTEFRTDKMYCSETLFDPPKKRKRKNLTKTQRKLRRMKSVEDAADILQAKYAVKSEKMPVERK